MSINDLIHTNAHNAFEQGVKTEQERIIKLLEPEITRHFELGLEASAHYLEGLIAQIKGEQK